MWITKVYVTICSYLLFIVTMRVCHEKFGPGAKFGPRTKFCNEKSAKLIPPCNIWTHGSQTV